MTLDCRITGGELVISVSITTLAHAASHSEYFFRCAENGDPLKITDEETFAKSVCRALNDEAEDGSTPITRMLDAAFEYVAEQGEDGVEVRKIVSPGTLIAVCNCPRCRGRKNEKS